MIRPAPDSRSATPLTLLIAADCWQRGPLLAGEDLNDHEPERSVHCGDSDRAERRVDHVLVMGGAGDEAVMGLGGVGGKRQVLAGYPIAAGVRDPVAHATGRRRNVREVPAPVHVAGMGQGHRWSS